MDTRAILRIEIEIEIGLHAGIRLLALLKSLGIWFKDLSAGVPGTTIAVNQRLNKYHWAFASVCRSGDYSIVLKVPD